MIEVMRNTGVMNRRMTSLRSAFNVCRRYHRSIRRSVVVVVHRSSRPIVHRRSRHR